MHWKEGILTKKVASDVEVDVDVDVVDCIKTSQKMYYGLLKADGHPQALNWAHGKHHQQVREKLSGFPHLSGGFELSYPNLESRKAVIR